MKKINLLLVLSCFVVSLSAQSFWKPVNEHNINYDATKRAIHPQQYQTLSLDFDGIRAALASAPQEFTNTNKPLLVELPMPDGSMELFRVVDSPVFAPALAAKYPQIRAFQAYAVNQPTVSARLDYSPRGFHAVINSPQGEVYIDPLAEGETTYYQTYFTRDDLANASEGKKASCGYHGADAPNENPIEDLEVSNENIQKSSSGILQLRSYRIAVSTTSAFANRQGGTVAGVLAGINTALNRLNEIFQNEIAVRFVLIDEVEDLIFLDAATEPYNDLNQGTSLLGQSLSIFDNLISRDKYDIGHIFTGNCSDVGGVARLAQVCDENKMRGVSCFSGSLTAEAQRVLAHEVGHQFGAQHTMSKCDGNEDQESPSSAYEPGSGSTIMSYSGGCGQQNVQNSEDPYFHIFSVDQMITYSRQDMGNSCATLVDIENNEPVIDWQYEDGFFIPINTPFTLVTSATDADGDDLTYCWEQFDLGPPADLGEPILTSPIFRSFPPRANPRRNFPKNQSIVNNTREQTEVLPTYDRQLTFRCSVRDNNPAGGATVWREVQFQAEDNAGPFLVTFPNTGEEVMEVGEYVEITWDVANTNNNKINCQNVNIVLSTDGGYNYPVTLIENTPNDGAEFVTIPDAIGDEIRIKVEAADNIFFDISNKNAEIVAPSAPGYALTLTPNVQQVCLPATASVEISTASLLDFSENISLEIIAGLPEGATATFSDDEIAPSENTTLSIDLTNVGNLDGEVQLTLQATAADTNIALRTIILNTVNTDFSAITTLSPEDGASGVVGAPTFMWSASPYADKYDFELATDPSFSEASIVEAGYGLTELEYSIAQPLEEFTTFYWHVRGINECGAGEYTTTSTLSSVSAICSPTNSPNVPTNLPGSISSASSTLTINASGTINDVQVPIIRGSYPGVNGLRFILKSPAGTEVVLFSRNCGLTNGFNIGFDDEAPSAINCPPTSGNVDQPVEPLAAFIGEDQQGTWTLTVDIQDPGFGGGGSLDEWSLEFCSLVGTTTIANSSLVTLFPNPAKDILNVQMEQPLHTDAVLSVYNVQGQLLLQNNINSNQLSTEVNTTTLPSGVYILSILADNQLFTKQFTKI